MSIDTGDVVHHMPTGEKWVVAWADERNLCCCGWPETIADVSDCALVEKATPEVRLKLLLNLAAMNPKTDRGGYDTRPGRAQEALEKELTHD